MIKGVSASEQNPDIAANLGDFSPSVASTLGPKINGGFLVRVQGVLYDSRTPKLVRKIACLFRCQPRHSLRAPSIRWPQRLLQNEPESSDWRRHTMRSMRFAWRVAPVWHSATGSICGEFRLTWTSHQNSLTGRAFSAGQTGNGSMGSDSTYASSELAGMRKFRVPFPIYRRSSKPVEQRS